LNRFESLVVFLRGGADCIAGDIHLERHDHDHADHGGRGHEISGGSSTLSHAAGAAGSRGTPGSGGVTVPADNSRANLEQVFFAYADQKASLALDNHLGVGSRAWDSELISAWSRFVIAIHLRHPDAMPELRAAAKEIWDASGVDYQAAYERIRAPGDPPTFDDL
jgi:hypothetical protein